MAFYAAVAIRGTGNSRSIEQFNACVTHTRFLALASHGQDVGAIETIEDRALGTVVGEVTANHSPANTLGGAAAENDGYVMSTATPRSRDATAIEGCWDHNFPVADS
jgi:hypothetical protein